jgi:O-antigen ligase
VQTDSVRDFPGRDEGGEWIARTCRGSGTAPWEILMHLWLAAFFVFGILTLWVPAWWPVTVFQVGAFVLAGIAGLRALRRPPALVFPIVPLAFAVLWGWFQWVTGRTSYAFASQNALVHWATLLAVFWVAIKLCSEPKLHEWFRTAMVWFGFLIAVLATLQTFTAGDRAFWIFPTGYYGEFMAPFPYHNHYAAFIEVVLPMALYRALQRERGFWLYGVMAAAMYASVIASASRSGTALATGELIAVGTIVLVRRRMLGRTAGLSLLGVALLLAVFVAVVGPETVWARFQAPDPMSMRREFAESSLGMIASHPWWGVGLGTWPTVYPGYAVADFGVFANQAHSDWLQWAAEGGIPFVMVLATLFIWSIPKAMRSVWGLGAVAVFFHASVDYPFSHPVLGSWVILVLALLAVESGRRGEDPIPGSIGRQSTRVRFQQRRPC